MLQDMLSELLVQFPVCTSTHRSPSSYMYDK